VMRLGLNTLVFARVLSLGAGMAAVIADRLLGQTLFFCLVKLFEVLIQSFYTC
jgi:hypothetical protein